jgi:hypothetical protein
MAGAALRGRFSMSGQPFGLDDKKYVEKLKKSSRRLERKAQGSRADHALGIKRSMPNEIFSYECYQGFEKMPFNV